MRNAHKWHAKGRRDQRGAVAVEFALVLIPLIMLMFGIISGGLAYYQKITIADAVREGARFAATADTATTHDWEQVVRDRTVAASTGALTDSNVCVVGPSGGSCPGGSTPPTLTPGTCAVQVQGTVPDVTFTIGVMSWEIDLVQDAYARYERTC